MTPSRGKSTYFSRVAWAYVNAGKTVLFATAHGNFTVRRVRHLLVYTSLSKARNAPRATRLVD